MSNESQHPGSLEDYVNQIKEHDRLSRVTLGDDRFTRICDEYYRANERLRQESETWGAQVNQLAEDNVRLKNENKALSRMLANANESAIDGIFEMSVHLAAAMISKPEEDPGYDEDAVAENAVRMARRILQEVNK